MTGERWRPRPQPGDGPDGRGESGPGETLETRRETEEAAASGRFPAGDEVRDDSNPIEPHAELDAVPQPTARRDTRANEQGHG